MVATPDGWWMICLGIRPQSVEKFHTIGRETFFDPGSIGRLTGGSVVRPVELTMPAPDLPEKLWKPENRPKMISTTQNCGWNGIIYATPMQKIIHSPNDRGYLRLWGSAVTMNDKDSPAFIGRRQTGLTGEASTRLSFDPQRENEEPDWSCAAMTKIITKSASPGTPVSARFSSEKIWTAKLTGLAHYEKIGSGDIILSVQATPLAYEFFYSSPHGRMKSLGVGSTHDLSSENLTDEKHFNYNFTGVFIGLYATGNGQTNSVPADFDWFKYDAK